MSGEFMARIFLVDNDVESVVTFSYELEPDIMDCRTVENWANDHICESYKCDQIKELFSIPKGEPGVWQIIFKGRMEAVCLDTAYGYEWESEMHIDESQRIKMADSWRERFGR